MAFSAGVVIEVRPGSGSDTTCSGCFDPTVTSPGTDYSVFNSAQVTFIDLVIGSTTTQLTSSAFPFSSLSPGNSIQITSGGGFTTGTYIVESVSGTTATMDRSVGSASSTGGHGYLGGALATMSQAITLAIASNTIYLKGTYTATTAQILSLASSANPTVISGYSTARNDGTQATWTTSTNSINLLNVSSLQHAQIKNIIFSNTAGTKGTGSGAGNGIIALTANAVDIIISNCVFTGFTVGLNLDWQNIAFTIAQLQMENCIVKNSVGVGFVTTAQCTFSGCVFEGNGSDAFRIMNTTNSNANYGLSVFFGCVFYNNSGHGFYSEYVSGPNLIGFYSCVFASNTGDGMRLDRTSGSVTFWNNICYGNGGYGVNETVGTCNSIPRGNAFGSNTSGARNNFPTGTSDVNLTANPFTNPSGGNFTLNSTAGGGASCISAGYQSPTVI